jgi:hypothetical protein
MLPSEKKANWMASPGIHSHLKNVQNEVELQNITNSTVRQKTGISIPAGRGKLLSIMIPAVRGMKSLKKGAIFQIVFPSAFLFRLKEKLRFLQSKPLNSLTLQSLHFF